MTPFYKFPTAERNAIDAGVDDTEDAHIIVVVCNNISE